MVPLFKSHSWPPEATHAANHILLPPNKWSASGVEHFTVVGMCFFGLVSTFRRLNKANMFCCHKLWKDQWPQKAEGFDLGFVSRSLIHFSFTLLLWAAEAAEPSVAAADFPRPSAGSLDLLG